MLNLIPVPYKSEEKYGEFVVNHLTSVYADSELTKAKDVFVSLIEKICGYKIHTVISKNASIKFLFDRIQPEEGYRIECTTEGLAVYASGYVGAFYAVMSLRQLFCMDIPETPTVLSMHAVSITDKPRYGWRGIMLDESRHFFGAEVVKQLLDWMAMYKLNIFHWHLTDNEGWRVEIKKYPKLTEIGSVRRGTQTMAWGRPNAINWVSYGGYYTQEAIRDIIDYAKERNITIIPEIDLPAHFAAAIAAYPQLSCGETKIEPSVRHSENADIIACVGKESTYRFVYDVLDELCELFPAPYFHIGGDEASKKEWKRCPLCQKVMKDKKLADEEALQGYFNNKIALYLKRKGKAMIGWNEILTTDNLERGVIAQYWTEKRDRNVEKHALDGRKIIISKHQAFYFDMPYAKVRLSDTYKFEPEKAFLIEDWAIGIEAPLWTEWVSTPERLQFQLFPRIEALSEVAWSAKEARNYHDFRKRLRKRMVALDRMKINFAPENTLEKHSLNALRIFLTFLGKNAHVEYEKAMRHKRRK
ncbi:MAG: beta-N-acetylhexosaminidase [Clostridia bacterium]|nr:beta-N-acetylhexosaminidase [Clostridia bacterium]